MLNYEFPPIGGGGGNAHFQLLREYANKDNLKVDVLTCAARPGLSRERFAENVTIYKVGIHKKDLHLWKRAEVIEWLIKAGTQYRNMLKRDSYNLAHAFFGFPTGWLCYRSSKKLPYIISLRGSDVPGEHARLKLDYKVLGPVFCAIWRNAAALVACSQGLKERALRFLPSVSIEVIPNGVDTERFHPADTNDKSDVLRLLTVGRLSVTKRVEILIDAVEILHKEGRKMRLTIVGGGQLEGKLRDIVSSKGLGGIIGITGRVDAENMPQIYRRNDIYISASMQEGMSNAMLEAMASGLPIITTPCEGVEELIADNGILVEEPQAYSIADAVKRLAGDRKAYEQMAFAARKHAEKFSWSSVAHRYTQLYNENFAKRAEL